MTTVEMFQGILQLYAEKFDGRFSVREFQAICEDRMPSKSPSGISIYIQNCTVNHKGRQMTSGLTDLFISHNGKLYKYTPEKLRELEVPYYEDLSKIPPERALQDFLSAFESRFKLAPKTSNILVVTNCSGSKLNIKSAIPAHMLYQGPQHKRIKESIDTHFVDWYIVSGKFGLISSNAAIPTYEQNIKSLKYSIHREAVRAHTQITDNLITLINTNNYQKVVIGVAALYHIFIDFERLARNISAQLLVIGNIPKECKVPITYIEKSSSRDLNFQARHIAEILDSYKEEE